MALESGTADLDKIYDVRQPLVVGPYTIKDLYPAGPAAQRARHLPALLQRRRRHAGAGSRHRAPARVPRAPRPHRADAHEAGPLAPPAAAQALGKDRDRHHRLRPRPGGGAAAVRRRASPPSSTAARRSRRRCLPGPTTAASALRVVSAATSAKLREIMRLNVTHPAGTGRRAEAEGYRVGGKTGTAEMPGRGGYQEKAVISSFVGAFPMDAPQYVVLVLLFEPQPARPAATTSPPASTPRPATGPHRRAHRARCSASCRRHRRGTPARTRGPSLTPHARRNKKRQGMQARRDSRPTRTRRGAMKLASLLGPEIAAPPGCGDVEIAGHHGRQPRRCGRAGCSRRCPAAKADGARFVPDAIAKGAAAILVRQATHVAGAGRRAGPRAAEPRRALALMAARFYPAQPDNHRRRHRHQRQDLGRRLHAPDLRRARPQGRLARHHRPGQARRRRLRRAHHARSGHAAPDAGRAGRRGHHAPGLRGLLARARPASARRRAAEGRRLHQPRPRPSRLSPDHGGLSRRQAAPVRRAAAAGWRGRRQCRCRARARA